MKESSARAKWSRLVTEWKKSGLTGKEFAGKHGIAPSTLSWWHRRLSREGERSRDSTAASVGLVSVSVQGGAEETCAWELTTSSGAVLRVHRAIDKAALREVLAALTRPRRGR